MALSLYIRTFQLPDRPILPYVVFFLVLIPGFSPQARAQEYQSPKTLVDSNQDTEVPETFKQHVFSVLLAHDHVSQGLKDGERTWLTLPSFMLAYNYKITEHFSVGLAGDIIIEQFAVEPTGESEVENFERSYPVALVATATYRVVDHLGVLAGGGFEYAKEDTFGLIRFGIEPFLKISHTIELILNVSYDIRIDAYDNWNLGFGVAVEL